MAGRRQARTDCQYAFSDVPVETPCPDSFERSEGADQLRDELRR